MPARRQATQVKGSAIPARRQIRESPFWRTYSAWRYTILFYALLLTLLIMPIATTTGMAAMLIKVLVGTCLLVAVMPNASRGNRRLILAAALLLVLARIAADQGYLPVDSGLILALVGVVGLATAAGALRFVIKAKVVNHETIYAALSTYLLAGLFFGQIYWSLEQLSPGSLSGPEELLELGAVYFSFVTLASLGYGDILPRSDIARGVATFEVIGGQLFLAVMVARLISLFTEKRA